LGSEILAVATAVPEHRLDAAQALEQLRRFFPRLHRLGEAEAGLGTRYTCEPVKDLLRPRGLTEITASYLRHAKRLALEAACKALAAAGLRGSDVDLVITVSCTGYLVPSLDVHMAADLGLRPDVLRLPITELGCSAGAAALAAAHRHLAGFPDDHVLVVAVEVPSLSFQRSDGSLDNLTASLVFGDGAGAAVLGKGEGRLRLERAASHLVPGSADVLGFDLRDGGFHVVLDRRLPRVLRDELAPVVEQFMASPDFYLVHAAGPRIFTAVEAALRLPSGALDMSRQVFAEAGNTSSAAIFFVLEKLMCQEDVRGDGLGIGLGPGVTLELMHLKASTKRSQNPSMSRPVPTSALG
jgi:predicted naringenin-chalcone synthase